MYAIGYLNTDTNSNYLVTTGLICKLDTAGNLLWSYLYHGAPYANQPGGVYGTPDSGVLLSVDAGPYPNLSHAHLIKLDKNGTLQWDRLLPFSMGNNYVKLIDYIPATKECVFLASTYSDSMLIVKTDSNMHRVWNVSYLQYDTVGDIICNFSKIKKDRWGYICMGGYNRRVPDYSGSLWLLKIDDNGNKVWQAFYDSTITKSTSLVQYGGNNIGVFDIDTLPDGGYIIGGTIQDSLYNQTATVMRLDSNGCLTDPCEAHLITDVAKVAYIVEARVYPNPASSQLHVDVSTNTPATLQISDLLGRLVYTQPLHGNTTAIDCLNWPSGLYMYTMYANGAIMQSGKLVVAH